MLTSAALVLLAQAPSVLVFSADLKVGDHVAREHVESRLVPQRWATGTLFSPKDAGLVTGATLVEPATAGDLVTRGHRCLRHRLFSWMVAFPNS